jgi:Cdc6-like AAA superfamily ATPase
VKSVHLSLVPGELLAESVPCRCGEARTQQKVTTPESSFSAAVTSWTATLETELLAPGHPVSKATIDEGFAIYTRFRASVDPSIARSFQRVNNRIESLLERLHHGSDPRRSAVRGIIDDLRLIAAEADLPPSRRGIAQEIVATLTSPLSNAPRISAIVGPPGIGKTHLWRRIAARLSASKLRSIYYKAPQTGGLPLSAVRTVMRQILTSPDRGVRGQLELQIERIDAHGDARVLLSALLSEDRAASTAGAPPIASSSAFSGLASAIRQLISLFDPVVVALDDIQWIDEASLRVLSAVFSEPVDSSLFLIGATRRGR